jgi:RNA polymerase sigma-70 factor (ECF subfamily)
MQDADAREVVQEVLISVMGAIDRFDVDGAGSFRGWLSRITRNETIDRLRTLSSRKEMLDASGVARKLEQQAIDESTESIRDEFDSARRKQLFLWAAVHVRSRTGEVNWMAFWKTSVDGIAIDQVATELGISEGAVYVARCRILKRIRECVDERLNE